MARLNDVQLSLLRAVRLADEDSGGLSPGELDGDGLEELAVLVDAGLVEAVGEYGEAPDGEMDEHAAGESAIAYRITGRGVELLRDRYVDDFALGFSRRR